MPQSNNLHCTSHNTHFGFNFFLTSVVEIGFSEVTYNVSEGASETVTVAVMNGPPDRDVTVSLSTINVTATGRRKTTILCNIYVQKSESHSQ